MPKRTARPTPTRKLRRAPLTLIFGRMKSGKSYQAKSVVRSTRGRVWVWDPNAEWAGSDAVDAPGDLWPATDWQHALNYIARGGDAERVAWQLRAERFPAWCELVRRTGGMLAVVDEAHDVVAPHRVPAECMRLVRRTRHSRIDLVFVAQRPAGVDVSIRSQAHQVVSFQQTEARDLDWIGGHCGRDVRRRVEQLPVRECVVWEAGRKV